MNFRQLFAQAFLTSGFYVVTSQVVGFLGLWVSLKFLEQKDVGLYSSIAAFSNFLLYFSINGISQIVHRENYDQKQLSELSLISLLLGAFFMLVMMGLALPIDWFFSKNQTAKYLLVAPSVVVSAVFVIQSFWSVPRAILQKEDRYGLSGRMILGGQIVNSFTQVWFAYLGFGHWSMIFCQLASNAFLSVWAIYMTGIWPVFFGMDSLRAHIVKVRKFILSVSSITLIQYGSRNLDNILIGRYFGQNALGIYDVAYKFLFFPLMAIAGVATQVIYPMFAKIKDDFKQFETEFFFLMSVLNLLGWIAGLGIVFLAPLAVSWFFKEQWQPVKEYLPYFGLILYGQTLISPTSAFYILLKKEKQLFFITALQGITFLIGFLVALYMGPLYFAKLLLLQVVGFGLPAQMIWANSKYLGFNLKTSIAFWTPKIAILLLLYVFLEFKMQTAFCSLCSIYSLWLVFREVRKIRRFLGLLRQGNDLR